MKIKFWTSKKYAFELIINKRYKAAKTMIPIGCDCHPAHLLKTLNLRKYSFPFDWLDTNPLHGLTYVYENISNQFEFFLSDLKKDNDEKVYANTYKYATFYHYNDLIINKEFQLKLQERSAKLLKLIKTTSCFFLNTVTSESITSNDAIQTFLNSVNKFQSILKSNDKLIIYVRYDESLNENKQFCDKLIAHVQNFKNVIIVQYIRKKEKYGIWGDEKQYPKLIKKMGILIQPTFPKITFSKKPE